MDPNKEEKTLSVGFLNIYGQTNFNQAKVNQIEFLVKTNKIDILHLQETNISEETFENSNYLKNNYQILFQNNESGFGVCSLIKNDLETKNVLLHPSGRLISFDVEDLTMINVYLQSGNSQFARNQREEFSGKILPNILLNSKKKGICGGDWNSIIQQEDCSHLPETKMSPSLKRLVALHKWKDCFRTLHPKEKVYSHVYNRQNREGLTKGGSRLDRAYCYGEVEVVSAEYKPAALSDHMLHLIKIKNNTQNRHSEPSFKSHFKISPDIARDDEFKKEVARIVQGWEGAKSLMPLIEWWELLKIDIRNAAKKMNQERERKRKSLLNYLTLSQIHLARKVAKGEFSLMEQLKTIQIKINDWLEQEAEKVKLKAKLRNIEESEKVSIYHHEKLRRETNKNKIMKLKTEDGKVIEGHEKCANLLNNEAKEMFGKEVELDEEEQEELLKEVEEVFTEKDNEMLEKEITDQEIKESLGKCNSNSAPGTDGLTFLTYAQCWQSIGTHLGDVIREIFQKGKSPATMRHSQLVFSVKPQKPNSLLTRDKRKLAMLQTDHKILTGVLAARLKRTVKHTISPQQYAAGPRKITHAITQARDCVNNLSTSKHPCCVVELDMVAAYDKMQLNWIWKVLLKKKCSEKFVEKLKQIFEDSERYIISVINGQPQERFLNKRKHLGQGDRSSTILFIFGMEPVLIHLQKYLKGVIYHKRATEGPAHPLFGNPTQAVEKIKLLGFVDDIKTFLSSMEEFETVDRVMKKFEKASGSQLHRDPTTKKCQAMGIGKYKELKQSDIPVDYISLVEEINFLGVTIAKTTCKSRTLNGELLLEKTTKSINSFKAGRNMPMTSKPFAANT